ncbi:rhodanese-like domain-containing protein [Aquibacillus koreensis]|uniref:Rhodanese-like domain-containing protein n=1 Tax=Aquibacillus koreensis TaxID=279446 RepID=A0A9X3WNB7_9BACI|nr:rhodanese-like domain-containing protein [Aquibacillus koreensis]MCT2536858.1 rhodanese-like domain-containing protein [Aquibacillus koreensis]MDC3422010.1 rhodanese-like domain-containing protein [Aquibacillus koreensis]
MKNIISILVLIVIVLFVGYMLYDNQGIKTISTTELADKMQESEGSNDVVFVDVREPDEYESGHIEAMINFPLSALKDDHAALPTEKELVLICRSGKRSMEAAKILNELGYEKIVSVDGGVMDWEGKLVN